MADVRGTASRRSSVWLVRAVGAGIAVGAFVGVLPTIVARSPLLDWLVAWASRDVRGTIHVGSAALSWFHPPVLRDVELRDPQGRPIVAAPIVELSRSLVSLALDSRHLGTVVFRQPDVHYVAIGDDSNVERALAAFIDGEPTSPFRTGIHVVIHDGTLRLRDEDTQEEWLIQNVAGTVEIPRDRLAAIAVACTGQVEIDGRPNNLDVKVGYRSGEGGPGLPPQIHVSVTTDLIPAAAIATFLRRVEPNSRCQGVLAGHLDVIWNDERPEAPILTIQGKVSGRKLSVLWPGLSREPLALGTAECPIDLVWSSGRIVSRHTRLRCAFGEIRWTGTLDWRGDPIAVLRQGGFEAAGDIDLAAVGRWLAHPLRLREDLILTGGRLVGEIRSETRPDGIAWSGRVMVSDLRGERAGQSLFWHNPIRIEWSALQGDHGFPRIERGLAQTDFGTVHISGTDELWNLDGRLDLAQLWQRARQFLHWDSESPRGSLTGRATLSRDRSGGFRLLADARIRDAEFPVLGASWREPDLQLRAELHGRTESEACRIDVGQIVVVAASDSLRLDLLEPIPDLSSPANVALQALIRGGLSRWLHRLAPVIGWPDELQAAAAIDGSARLRVGRSAIQIDQLDLGFVNGRFSGWGWTIVEPNARLRLGRFEWRQQADTRSLALADLTWESPGLGLVVSSLHGEGPRRLPLPLTGRAEIRGDLARWHRWLPQALPEPPSGSLDGTVHVHADGPTLRLQSDVTVRQFVVGSPSRPVWSEPLVRATLRGQYHTEHDQWILDDGKLELGGVAVSWSGRASSLTTTGDFQLTGTAQIDWARLEPQLRHLMGREIRLVGRESHSFRLEGSLNPRQLTPPQGRTSQIPAMATWKGDWSIGWQSLHVLGCAIGPAQWQARMLGDGWVRFAPVETTLNRGRLYVEPFIKLDEPKPLLILSQKSRLDRAQITAGVSNESLGYAAPSLAGLRDPLGEFSVMIEGAKVPLADLSQADVRGQVTIHSIKATPGPLLTEITRALKLPVGLNVTKEQTIPVRLVQGRVHHQNLEIPLGDIDLKTSGSVGLDGTLNVIAEFPTPSRWLGKNALKSLSVIRLPIGGTITAPRIDPQSLQQIVGRYAIDSAGELLQREIEKRLPKWFQGPPKKP